MLRAASEFAADNIDACGTFSVQVDGVVWRLTVANVEAVVPLDLSDAHKAVVAAAEGKGWTSVKSLARKTDYTAKYARGIVADLVRLEVFERGPDGVRKKT